MKKRTDTANDHPMKPALYLIGMGQMRYYSSNGIAVPRRCANTFGAVLDTMEVSSMDNRTTPRWTAAEDAALHRMYPAHSLAEIAAALGRTVSSVRNRRYTLKIPIAVEPFSAKDLDEIREWYESRDGQPLMLDWLAVQLGRPKTSIATKARELGLTNMRRTRAEKVNGLYPSEIRKRKYESMEAFRAALPEIRRELIRKNGHPRGALGMKHTDETKRIVGEKSRAWNASLTLEQREAMRVKRNTTNIERYGTANPTLVLSEKPYSRARGGKREDLDNRYFRSRWEANYMRYLLWLKAQGQIADVLYEPQTFVFQGVTRGVLTYTPDFKVIEKDGSYCWHEVKGWMDPSSKAKLKRMAKFYPDEKIIVIGEEEYKAIAKWKSLIPEWETTKND